MKPLLCIFSLFFAINSYAQNVGIGTTTPGSRLEVSSNSNSQPNVLITDSAYKGLGVLRFSSHNYPGKYMQMSGYKSNPATAETYLSITSDSAQIIGFRGNGHVSVNSAGADYPLNVAGDVDISYNGALRLNGNSGTAGQVLTSGGEGQPSTWANQAFTEKVRFYFQGGSSSTVAQDSLIFGSTVYNLNPASVVKTGKYITFNKTGLYHFDFFYNCTASFGSQAYPPLVTLQLRMSSTPERAYFCISEPFQVSSSGTPPTSWRLNLHESKEIYITAGTTIAALRANQSFTATTAMDHFFILSGYLISE